MAGLMSRASLVVKSKLSKLLDRAEDPGETLDYSYEKQLELLQNVKRGIADVVTAKKRLELQETKLQESIVKLETQARQALAEGREDLARQALERKSGLQQQLQGLDQQTKQLEAQQEKLIASEKARSDTPNTTTKAAIGMATASQSVRGVLAMLRVLHRRHECGSARVRSAAAT